MRLERHSSKLAPAMVKGKYNQARLAQFPKTAAWFFPTFRTSVPFGGAWEHDGKPPLMLLL